MGNTREKNDKWYNNVVVCCLAFSVRAKKLPELQVWRGNWQTWRCWVLRGGGRSGRGGIRQLRLWLDEWSCKFNLRLTKFCQTILLHVDVICSRLKLVTVFWILGYASFQETMTMPRKDFVTHPWVWNRLTYHWGEILQPKPCPPEMKSWNLLMGYRFSESYCKLMQIHGDFMEKNGCQVLNCSTHIYRHTLDVLGNLEEWLQIVPFQPPATSLFPQPPQLIRCGGRSWILGIFRFRGHEKHVSKSYNHHFLSFSQITNNIYIYI